MKGRFAQIFEILNQINTEYYQQVFDKKVSNNFFKNFCPTIGEDE